MVQGQDFGMGIQEMKVTVLISDGKFCVDCQLLGWWKGGEYDCGCEYYCNWCFGRLNYEDGDCNQENPIKHSDCPSLKGSNA